jgi:cytochrome P450
MIQYPDVWKRAAAEIRSEVNKGRMRDRVVTYEDSRKLPFLEACIYESLRMFGPGPFQLSRVAPPGGITIGPEHFPAGTVLSINPQ